MRELLIERFEEPDEISELGSEKENQKEIKETEEGLYGFLNEN